MSELEAAVSPGGVIRTTVYHKTAETAGNQRFPPETSLEKTRLSATSDATTRVGSRQHGACDYKASRLAP